LDYILVVIEKELDELRRYVAYFDNSPGPEPTCSRSDIQEALRPVLAALEKLAAAHPLVMPALWMDPDGDVWTWDSAQRCLRWEYGKRRVLDGEVQTWRDDGWRRCEDDRAQTDFYRAMWAHFAGKGT
jgi:hypothetical protein